MALTTLSPWPLATSAAALTAARACLRTELGRSGADLTDAQLDRLGGAAAAEVEAFAAGAPQPLKDEAVIRVVGYLVQVPAGLHEKTLKSPDGSEVTLKYARGMSNSSPLRSSGASAILARHRTMGVGTISG